jgi:DNA polymerase-4
VRRISGVGGKMAAKLEGMGIRTCGELQQFDKIEMARRFGRWGLELWELCRGIDAREVKSERVRKSMSTESTFRENLHSLEDLRPVMHPMIEELAADLVRYEDRHIRALVLKMKFADFTRTTAERAHSYVDEAVFEELLAEAWQRGEGKAVRLLGVGVRFKEPEEKRQLELL